MSEHGEKAAKSVKAMFDAIRGDNDLTLIGFDSVTADKKIEILSEILRLMEQVPNLPKGDMWFLAARVDEDGVPGAGWIAWKEMLEHIDDKENN